MPPATTLVRNIGELAICRAAGPQNDVHAVPRGAVAWSEGRVTWAGAERDLPRTLGATVEIDAGGRLVIPGLVDCHTHLAFAGWRADEFERRLSGESYLEIARAGGGIRRTVAETRAASAAALTDRAAGFLRHIARLGVTTVECKSGYGLTVDDELKLLRVYSALTARQALRIVPTLLAAHVVPAEFEGDREGWIRVVCDALIPQVAAEGLAACCDVFVEREAFSTAEGRRVLAAGRAAGLAPKVHADQLSAGGGAELAAEMGAISADHLEHVSAAGIDALRRAGTVAVSLPIASACLGTAPMPARQLIAAGVPVAVATDFNPGSAPCYDLPLALWLACTLQRMTPAEALKGATIHAARACGVERETGSLEPGKAADVAIIDAESVTAWLYHYRPGACVRSWVGGREPV